MYPFKNGQTFVRNRWYLAGFSDEISRQPIERTILGKPVVMYRTQAGAPIALYGLCPHRYFPLAKGWVDGDSIVCGYHAFAFAADGKCVSIPSQGTAAGFCQPSYPLRETGELCWIWMGDPDRCDPALIPPVEDFGLGLPGWRFSSANHFTIKARAQLLIDNLMDLTHLPYLHHHVSGGEAMKAMPMREELRERSYRLVRTGKLPWTDFADLMWGQSTATRAWRTGNPSRTSMGRNSSGPTCRCLPKCPVTTPCPPRSVTCISFMRSRPRQRHRPTISASPAGTSASTTRRSTRSSSSPTRRSGNRTLTRSKPSRRELNRLQRSNANFWSDRMRRR